MKHEAQPENLSVFAAVRKLSSASDELVLVAQMLLTNPKPGVRQQVRRRLSGVLADVETVRLAIKE